MKKDLVELYEVDRNTALLLRRWDRIGYLVRLMPGEEWNGFPADAGALRAGRVDPQWTAVDLEAIPERQRELLTWRPVAEWQDGKVHDVAMGDASEYVEAYAEGTTMVMVWMGRTPLFEYELKHRKDQRAGRAGARRRRRKWDLSPLDERGLLAYQVLTAARLAHETEKALTLTLDGLMSRDGELAELVGRYRGGEGAPKPAALVELTNGAAMTASALREHAEGAASMVLAALGYGPATLEGLSVLDRLSDAFRVIGGDESAAVEALTRMSVEVKERERPPLRGTGNGG